MVGAAKKFGMPAVGITDHGTFAGAIEFVKECRKQGIKPILGMEAYFSRDHCCHNKEGQPEGRKGNRHLNIIAKNYKGFQNLCSLSQKSSLDGYYYDPRIDWDLLKEHSEGLIVTSACLSNLINYKLLCGQYDQAKQVAGGFKEVFGEDFYLELMYHGIHEEGKILPDIQKLGKELSIKVIATNDCHYITREDSIYHETLMCMSSNRCIKDPKRIKFPFPEFYFKSQEEMAKIFGHVKPAMLNTLEVAEKCDYSDLIFGGMRLPHFTLPDKWKNPYEYLIYLCSEGMKRLNLDNSPEHMERLQRELDDIKLIYDTKKYDFTTYFLIVEDIMTWAKKNDIACGIRGSGYGSVLLKALGISEGVDPLQQDLLWERFLGFDDLVFLSESDFGIKEA